MSKDPNEVITLVKGVIEIDTILSKQNESIAKLREKHLSIDLIKEIDHIENALDNLQTVINSVYYNIVGE